MMRSPLTSHVMSQFTSSRHLGPNSAALSVLTSPLIRRRFSTTYKYNSLMEWLESDGKSVIGTPGYRNPRIQYNRCFKYTPLKYQGDERKKMIETTVIEWIGGAIHGLNMMNGKVDAYTIVGGSGTGKTRFLGEIFEQWDRLQALSVKQETVKAISTMPSREIPSNTLVFPISYNSLTTMTDLEVKLIHALSDSSTVDIKVITG